MNILLTAATHGEIAPLINHLDNNWIKQRTLAFQQGDHTIYIGITGVGMVANTYCLTKLLSSQKFDFAIQAGLAGSFDASIPLGHVVLVQDDQFADMGASDNDNFIDLFEMGLVDANEYPFTSGKLIRSLCPFPAVSTLKHVSSITVNTVSGKKESIEALAKKYACDMESMEGASFHYVCLKENIPFIQVRSISNYVEPRDKSKWKIEEAVSSLNEWLIDFVDNLETPGGIEELS